MPIKNTRKNNKLKDIEFIIEDEYLLLQQN